MMFFVLFCFFLNILARSFFWLFNGFYLGLFFTKLKNKNKNTQNPIYYEGLRMKQPKYRENAFSLWNVIWEEINLYSKIQILCHIHSIIFLSFIRFFIHFFVCEFFEHLIHLFLLHSLNHVNIYLVYFVFSFVYVLVFIPFSCVLMSTM